MTCSEPYHRSLGKRLTKSPKLYFMDTGLVCHLLGITDVRTLMATPLAGALWETFVVGQVVRHFQVRREGSPLWFWRTSRGDEVDLIIERGGRFVAVECKLTETPNPDTLRGIRALGQFYGTDSIDSAYVACRTSVPFRFKDEQGAMAVPVQDLIQRLA